jgi:NADH:ubiquinone oxidoreductase subunit E
MAVDLTQTTALIEKYKGQKGVLIPLLQEIQGIYGYVPRESIDLVAKQMGVFPVEIYGILTFYTQFYLEPRGKHIIKVCQGTACHVMGGKDILDFLLEKYGIEAGQTTKDGLFTLERAACLGCCGMAPVIVINEKFYGECTIPSISKTLDQLAQEK